MPIKKLQSGTNSRGLPMLGKLRKGGPKTGNKPGEDLDYHRFTANERHPEHVHIQEVFDGIFGEEPQEVPFMTPLPGLDDNWEAWQEEWVKGGLQHRCDGETCTTWLKPDGYYSSEPKPCPYAGMEPDKVLCKPVGRLKMVVMPLIEAGLVGVVIAETHSLNDIIHVESALRTGQSLAPNHNLAGMPWVLYRIEEEISTPYQGKRVRRKKWLWKLVPDPEWAQRRFMLAMNQQMAALPAGNEGESSAIVDTETGEIVDSDYIVTPSAPPEEATDAQPDASSCPPAENRAMTKADAKPYLDKALERDIPEKTAKEAIRNWLQEGLSIHEANGRLENLAADWKQEELF